MAKAELEAADSGCKVRESELAYWFLEHSGLANKRKLVTFGTSVFLFNVCTRAAGRIRCPIKPLH